VCESKASKLGDFRIVNDFVIRRLSSQCVKDGESISESQWSVKFRAVYSGGKDIWFGESLEKTFFDVDQFEFDA
jgi:hypothetical protein